MTDTITVDETRRLIKKLRGWVFLTPTEAADLLRLCDGLDIAEKLRPYVRHPHFCASFLFHGECDCGLAGALAEWADWKGER